MRLCSAWLFALLAACAQAPQKQEQPKPAPPPAPSALPATYVNDPDCPRCLAVTVTLRPDGAFLLRDQLGESEFYDFGAWRYADGTLELAGGRDTRRSGPMLEAAMVSGLLSAGADCYAVGVLPTPGIALMTRAATGWPTSGACRGSSACAVHSGWSASMTARSSGNAAPAWRGS